MANAVTGEVKEIFEEKVETQYESGRGKINWSYLDKAMRSSGIQKEMITGIYIYMMPRLES